MKDHNKKPADDKKPQTAPTDVPPLGNLDEIPEDYDSSDCLTTKSLTLSKDGLSRSTESLRVLPAISSGKLNSSRKVAQYNMFFGYL